jgi:selenocysteine-specific elongation factor
MRRLVLGTAGHIDHGKTTLVRALTGIDTDRLAEEKRRGITIDLGFARLGLEGVELGIVDVPGHEAFVRNMLAGATGIDLVLLVVAADEGVMPQTREHLAIVELLGVRGGVVAVTKTDLVEREWLELVVEEIREELSATPFARAPLVPVSAATGEGMEALRQALEAAAAEVGDRVEDDLFRLPIDRVFSVRGTGTVVTGTVWSGRVRRDQVVRLLPMGATARVRSIQVHGMDRDAAEAGQRAALGLVGVDRDRLGRGDVLVLGDEWRPESMLTVRLRLLPDTPWTVKQRQRVRLHLGTAEVMARVVIFDAEELAPGNATWAQLRLEEPIIARAGDRFVIRSYSPVTTIGGGIVAEPAAPKRKHLDERDRRAVEAALFGGPEEGIAALAEAAGWRGIRVLRIPIDTPHPPKSIDAAVQRLRGDRIEVIGERAFSRAVVDAATRSILDAIDAFHATHPLHPGIEREELRRTLPASAPADLEAWVVNRLIDRGVVEARSGVIAKTGFRPRAMGDRARIRDALLETIRAAGLTPPTVAELPEELRGHPDLRALLHLAESEGTLVALGPDLYMHSEPLNDAVSRIRGAFEGREGLTPADFKQVVPVSRKYLIPFLEYLDRRGITVRRGETRVLALGRPSA